MPATLVRADTQLPRNGTKITVITTGAPRIAIRCRRSPLLGGQQNQLGEEQRGDEDAGQPADESPAHGSNL